MLKQGERLKMMHLFAENDSIEFDYHGLPSGFDHCFSFAGMIDEWEVKPKVIWWGGISLIKIAHDYRLGQRSSINLQGFRRIGSGNPYCLPGNRKQAQRCQDDHSSKNIPDAARFDTAFFAALKSVLCFVHRETSDVSLEFESCHGSLCLKFSLLFFWPSRDRPLLLHGKHKLDKRTHQNSPDRFRRFVPFISKWPIIPFWPNWPVENNGVYLLVTYWLPIEYLLITY